MKFRLTLVASSPTAYGGHLLHTTIDAINHQQARLIAKAQFPQHRVSSIIACPSDW